MSDPLANNKAVIRRIYEEGYDQGDEEDELEYPSPFGCVRFPMPHRDVADGKNRGNDGDLDPEVHQSPDGSLRIMNASPSLV